MRLVLRTTLKRLETPGNSLLLFHAGIFFSNISSTSSRDLFKTLLAIVVILEDCRPRRRTRDEKVAYFPVISGTKKKMRTRIIAEVLPNTKPTFEPRLA